jgi:Cu-Zn family superoxide dismutase
MHRIKLTLAVLTLFALGGATAAVAGSGGGGDGDRDKRGRTATAKLVNADGERVGRVWMRAHGRRGDQGVVVVARVHDLTPGFHGFHIHTTGRCDAPGFTTAGGHFNPAGATHGSHAGDLPSLLVAEDGTAMLATTTDRFSLADLRDADGSAVMVHSGADNFANIPPRYAPPADQETLNTGDAGTRVACGVVR